MKQCYRLRPGMEVWVCDNQKDIDDCIASNLPVIAYDPEDSGLRCEEILLDLEGIDDAYLNRVYHRFYGLPMEILRTKRLLVRELSLSDVADLFLLYEGEGVTDFIEPLFPYEEELAYQKNYIEYIYGFYGYGMWLVYEQVTGVLVGRAGIETKDEWPEDTVEMGYVIGHQFQGLGYATEVCEAILRYAKEQLQKKRVVCKVHSHNIPSIRLMQRLGFEKVASGGTDDEDVWSKNIDFMQ